MSFNIGATTATTAAAFAPGVGRISAVGRSDNPLGNLTPDDLELVYQATGRRVTKDSELYPAFAAMIGIDRGQGRIAQGQPVNPDYLRNVISDIRSHPEASQAMADQADLALKYLLDGRAPGRQLTL